MEKEGGSGPSARLPSASWRWWTAGEGNAEGRDGAAAECARKDAGGGRMNPDGHGQAPVLKGGNQARRAETPGWLDQVGEEGKFSALRRTLKGR